MRDTNIFNAEEAYKLMEQGVWMRSGGYFWRNDPENKCGQYQACGEYPGCIRGCGTHTLSIVSRTSTRWVMWDGYKTEVSTKPS